MKAAPKRLIEVDLPIKRISAHARREKSIRHGHISTLHIWWARRPLAACRAVICAALWPDPADPLCPPSFRDAAATGERIDDQRPRAWLAAEGFVGRLCERPARLQVGGDGGVVPVGEIRDEVEQREPEDVLVSGFGRVQRRIVRGEDLPPLPAFRGE